MPPDTHTVPNHALDHTSVVRPPRCIVRNSHQRSFTSLSICGNYNTALIIRYLLARSLEQLQMYGRWERVWRAARRSGLVRGKLKTDEYPGRCEEGRDSLCPGWSQ